MNFSVVKEEEATQKSHMTITQFHRENLSLNQNNLYQQQWQHECATNKFMLALANLKQHQYLEQNQTTPKYPFVLDKTYNEIYVHLGGHHLEIANKPLVNKLHYQLEHTNYYANCCPPQVFPQPLILDGSKPIQKRSREINILQDQKDTKNIPKNYCKAIITFAQKNQHLCQQIFKDQQKVQKFLERLQINKKRLLNIKIFSSMLVQSDNPEEDEMNRAFRILSRLFIKKHAVNYIFNSKIVQHNWHLRYRQKIYKGVQNPKNFNHIKNL